MSGKELDNYIECSHKTSSREYMNEKISIAVTLAAKSGLRVSEIGKVRNKDRFNTDDRGLMLRVPEGKGDKYRETVLPLDMARADFDKYTRGEYRQNIWRWVRRVNEEYFKRYDDADVLGVTCHDLRRGFLTRMIESDANPQWVMSLSGHKSREVFYNAYVHVGSVEFDAEQRSKIDWIN